MKPLTSTKEVKAFVKRASASKIYEWVETIHKSGFVAGYTAAKKESINDTESVPSEQEPVIDGEDTSD